MLGPAGATGRERVVRINYVTGFTRSSRVVGRKGCCRQLSGFSLLHPSVIDLERAADLPVVGEEAANGSGCLIPAAGEWLRVAPARGIHPVAEISHLPEPDAHTNQVIGDKDAGEPIVDCGGDFSFELCAAEVIASVVVLVGQAGLNAEIDVPPAIALARAGATDLDRPEGEFIRPLRRWR